MVTDESSANGQKLPIQSDPGAHHPRPPHMTGEAGNLTQELAQLLAATIAQNQAARGMPGGVPTGSDLASLASLLSAAAPQRTLAPAFKDGLSALSYGPPPGRAPGGPEHADLHHDDEPMPIPSTWRQPAPAEHDQWFRQQMGAAVLGLVAGLIIVVPTVLWLSGWLGGAQKPKAAAVQTVSAPGEFSKPSDVKTVKVQVRPVDRTAEPAPAYMTGSVEPRAAAEAPRPAEPTVSVATARAVVPEPPRNRADELLARASSRIESGDVMGAREILAGADAHGPALFALAETYDPNMLAAWGTRGVVADVARARALYRKALELGIGKAQARLDGLN